MFNSLPFAAIQHLMKASADNSTVYTEETAATHESLMLMTPGLSKTNGDTFSSQAEDANIPPSRGKDVSQSTTDDLGVVLRPKRKTVSFGTVGCRLYERTAGLHPDVSSGPAITFSWTFHTGSSKPLEEYEALQGKRLTRTQLIIPKRDRVKILTQECGLSKTSIATYVRQINRIKTQRRQTIQNLKFAFIEENLQSIRKGASKMLFLRKSKNAQMKQLWKDAEQLESSLASTANLTCSSQSTNSYPSKSNLKVLSKIESPHQQQQDDDLDRARHSKCYDLSMQGHYLFPSRLEVVDDNTIATPKLEVIDEDASSCNHSIVDAKNNNDLCNSAETEMPDFVGLHV